MNPGRRSRLSARIWPLASVAAALGVVAVWAGAPAHTVLLVGVLLVRPATMLVMTRSMSGQQRRGGRDPAASWQRPAEPGHPDGRGHGAGAAPGSPRSPVPRCSRAI